ncbi:MAG: TIGR01459 family HAD-type hydrolase [Maritimibacter sp.]
MTRIIETLSEISDRYDALFCDLWGCVHDGIAPFPEAVAALQAYRAGGGRVILITNAPRQKASVEAQIDAMGLPRDCWDDIATSGDAARAAMYRGAVGQKVWHMGEAKDDVFFEPMPEVTDAVEITKVMLDNAEGIVCSGPFDPMAPPESLRPELLYAKTKGMKLLCANPDIIVDFGDERQFCAGAVAALYTEMGGESLYFGKPHPAIYDLARTRLSAFIPLPEPARILAVGDGIQTDIAGAMGEDFDSLFITGGLAAEDTGTERQPDPAKLESYLAGEGQSPSYAMGFLR